MNGLGVRKGAWTREEDILLRDCIDKFGEGKWHLVPLRAGLNRCRKSCRLRWLNYLRPNLKRGYFAKDEVDLIVRLHKLLGNRWSLIAGRLPGRTANDVKNFWNTNISKKPPPSSAGVTSGGNIITGSNIARPRPRTFSSLQIHAWSTQLTRSDSSTATNQPPSSSAPSTAIDRENSDDNGNALLQEDLDEWWRNLLEITEHGGETPFWFPGDEIGVTAPLFMEGIRDRRCNNEL